MGALSLRLRLAIAFVAVAALAVGLATLLTTEGLEPRLTDAARTRIARSADRLAAEAASRYRADGRWSEAAVAELEHVGLTTGLRLVVLDAGGRLVPTEDSASMRGDALHGPGATSRTISVGGRTVGTIHAAPLGGSLLSPADVDLRDSLDRLHMIAGAIAIGLALVVALALAQGMSAPLRRIRAAAERIGRGELDAEVEPGGDAEVRAVGNALSRLAETLEHEEQVRRESVADLAHELRTPVSGLLSRIEAAQDGVFADQGENLAAMHAEAERLRHLLDDLDLLAAAERPGLLLEKRRLDLASLAGSQSAQMEVGFAEKGVELRHDLRAVEIEGDPTRLAQIVTNLLSNALRYTEPGGLVELRAAPEPGGALLEVSDTGIGIEAADLPHIFKRFWRADRSRSRQTGGTGIGLAIVRELVVAHEGRIEVDSVPGRGSSFRVTFPLAPARVAPAGADVGAQAR